MKPIGERFRCGILCIGLGVFIPLGLLAKQSLAAVFISTALLLFSTTVWVRPKAVIPKLEIILLFFLLCLYVAITQFGGLHCQPCGFSSIGKLAVFGLLLWIASSRVTDLSEAHQRNVILALLTGIVMAFVILAIELTNDSLIYKIINGLPESREISGSRYNRGTSALVILIWPVAAWLWVETRRKFAAALVVISILISGMGESGSAFLASIVAVLVAGAAWLSFSITRSAIFVGTSGFVLVSPIVFSYLLHWVTPVAAFLPPSVLDRIEIWNHAARAVLESPVIGYGIGIIRHLPLPLEYAASYTYLVKPPTHPHNAAIQIWLELGSIGIAFLGIMFWYVTRFVQTMKFPWSLASLSMCAAIIVTAMISYGFWQETWLGIIGMAVLVSKIFVKPLLTGK